MALLIQNFKMKTEVNSMHRNMFKNNHITLILNVFQNRNSPMQIGALLKISKLKKQNWNGIGVSRNYPISFKSLKLFEYLTLHEYIASFLTILENVELLVDSIVWVFTWIYFCSR